MKVSKGEGSVGMTSSFIPLTEFLANLADDKTDNLRQLLAALSSIISTIVSRLL